MNPRTRLRLSRAALGLAAFAVIWALAVGAFGGVSFQAGGQQASSNNPKNPAILAALAALAAWSLATASQRRAFGDRLSAAVALLPARTAPAIAAAAAVAVLALGFTRGAWYAGGADAYGYISQADLWAKGELRYDEPLRQEFDWPYASRALAPLGYLPAADGHSMVPIYAPGLPMVMAVFQIAAGPTAVFWVVPLLSALAVWCTYLMGAGLAGRLVGASAAVLLATSPTFLFHTLIMPMSDVPATAWWALALASSLSPRRGAPIVGGLAVSLAILTRPNLAPLAVFPALLLCMNGLRDRSRRRAALRRGLWFAAGAVPGVLAVAALNNHLYGSPLTSGQLLVNPPFSLDHVPANMSGYSRWLIQTQTPLVLLTFGAPFAMRVRETPAVSAASDSRVIIWAWLGFIAIVAASYLVFMKVDGWIWLRYLLPAFPAMFVLMAGTLAELFVRLGQGVRTVGVGLVIALLASHGVSLARGEHAFDLAPGEAKYELAGRFIAEQMPARSVFLSMRHSGSIRYYSGRPTLLYEVIPPQELDRAVADLRARGYQPYLVIEAEEESGFRATFMGHTPVASLDLPVVKDFGHASGVRIFDLTARPPGSASER